MAILLPIQTFAIIGASVGMLSRSLIQLVIRFNVSAGAILTCRLISLGASYALHIPSLVAIFYFKLLPLFIDVYLVLIVTLILFDGDFTFGVGACIRYAIPSTISHFILSCVQ